MIKWLWGDKDGGPDSKVYCWGLEIKSLFSVLLLRFDQGSREAYHSHAFNSKSWLLSGALEEEKLLWERPVITSTRPYLPCIWPIRTYRETVHKVTGLTEKSWILTFRGPWANEWKDVVNGKVIRLTHGRREI